VVVIKIELDNINGPIWKETFDVNEKAVIFN